METLLEYLEGYINRVKPLLDVNEVLLHSYMPVRRISVRRIPDRHIPFRLECIKLIFFHKFMICFRINFSVK